MENAVARDLLDFVDASPSPFHCVETARLRLEGGGFMPLDERASWDVAPGARCYVVRGDGSLIPFVAGASPPTESGYRIVGAHTDSPNLRLKPKPARVQDGYLRLDVEVYGGAILATWVDRDLALAGRLFVDGDDGLVSRLVRIERPICRIPAVAIHLDRKVNDDGLKLDRHKHLGPAAALWAGEGDPSETLMRFLCDAAEVDPALVRGHDLCLVDTQPSAFCGLDEEFVLAPRLDNQGMCHAALAALLDAKPADATAMIALFDHEEVGSSSARGAAGPFLADMVRRLASPGGPEATERAVAQSFLVSADMAHAVHPSRGDLHDGEHLPRLNGGPVVKTNVSQRYATDAETGALFRKLCRGQEIPVQEFVTRADLPCGTTIGPISAAGLGIRTVDVGNPMLSMHSAREMAGSQDPEWMIRAMAAFLSGT